MKYLTFIIWLILTVVLCSTIIGLVVIIPHVDEFDDQSCRKSIVHKSTWMTIGSKLLDSILSNENKNKTTIL